ncbi:MAG: tRNA (adenosine(37)-N6)-threonylcarbamoyltransferase complex transferase subunit TsaD [Candidatus Liptonbacteria bacterium]|nr:tRNA (adenosine(37)-N6)-threonylcarbamoyltransferase complex transferase subunit TsaD [Candidatus Liptonbacteria bacterium]
MKILSIETSCDETGIALVEASGGLKHPRFKVLKNLISSQIKIHRPFGGVVPNLAKREHLKNLPILYRKIFGEATAKQNAKAARIKNVDLIAVTTGPGLEPALWAGITFAKELAKKYKKPLIGANHLNGHLYSFLLPQKSVPRAAFPSPRMFPAIALLVSGGHTILLKMDSLTKWKKLGETRDDAAGEAFDKVARMLKLPYPGGPEIERLALRSSAEAHSKPLSKGEKPSINFPRPMINTKDYDFSFSGLKTSVFYYLRDIEAKTRENVRENPRKVKIRTNSQIDSHGFASTADIAASFQQAVVDVLVSKTLRAAREYGARSIILCGGVAANKSLRKMLKAECDMSHLTFYIPHNEYNGDNAAMIAAAGYFAHLKNKKLPAVANGDLGI